MQLRQFAFSTLLSLIFSASIWAAPAATSGNDAADLIINHSGTSHTSVSISGFRMVSSNHQLRGRSIWPRVFESN